MKRANDTSELCEGGAYCRAWGHHWADPHKDAFGGRGRPQGWAVALICETCGCEKHFKLSRRGELSAPRYVYPENYLAAFFIGAEERGEFRLESLGLPVEGGAPLTVVKGGRAG